MSPVPDPVDTFVCAVAVLVTQRVPSALDGLALLYVGPDQIMPLTSLLTGAVGVLLMFWNRVVGLFRRIREFCSRR